MAYKLGDTPSARPSLSELADFLEIECFLSVNGTFSVTEAAQMMGIIDDESTPENEEDENLDTIKLALTCIDDRRKMSRGHYPFTTDVTSVRMDSSLCSSYYRAIYLFLLLATRENMRDNKIMKGIDGTVLFEHLCSEVLSTFFGSNSISYVFGTGSTEQLSFIDKLKQLLSRLTEKGYSVIDEPLNPNIKDGGIDVVCFIPFEDNRHGQFVVLAQCKTGTNWTLHISDLQPSLLDDYIIPPLVSKPYVVFLITDDYQEKDWRTLVRETKGIIFDRCRLMSFLPDQLSESLLKDIETWNNAVLEKHR